LKLILENNNKFGFLQQNQGCFRFKGNNSTKSKNRDKKLPEEEEKKASNNIEPIKEGSGSGGSS